MKDKGMNYLAESGVSVRGTVLISGVDICGCGSDCGAGAVRAGASGSGGTFGMYSGPICPQALNMQASIKALQIRKGRGK
jgi:hypothetical protein